MKILTYLLQGLHVVIGITPPPPEQTKKYVLIWLATLLASVLIVVGLGYLIMSMVFTSGH